MEEVQRLPNPPVCLVEKDYSLIWIAHQDHICLFSPKIVSELAIGYVEIAFIREAKDGKEAGGTSLATRNPVPGLLTHARLPCLYLPVLFQ